MAGSKKGGPQSKHFQPIRSQEDPRFKKMVIGRERYQQQQREEKQRHEEYQKSLRDLKVKQLEIAQNAISDGQVPEPISLLLEMIHQQRLIVNNPELTHREAARERTLLLDMQKQYSQMLSASAPVSKNIDLAAETEETMTKEDFERAFQEFTPKAVG